MTDRAYTVKEIDDLRAALRTRYVWGTTCSQAQNWQDNGPGQRICYSARSYKETDLVASVEEMVRTHMIAGHTAKDLIDLDLAKYQAEANTTASGRP